MRHRGHAVADTHVGVRQREVEWLDEVRNRTLFVDQERRRNQLRTRSDVDRRRLQT